MRRMSERDRRDWSLLVFIVPLGILLMLIAGQFAMRIIPQWILNTGMGSSLEVETAGGQMAIIQPLFNIQILTPYSWQNTYLTPNADSGFSFPPFVVLEPSATPSPTGVPPSTETATLPPTTVSPSATTVTPSATVVVTATTPPPQDTSTPPTTPTTCRDPLATNNGGSLPCVYPPTTCQDPLATNNGDPLPCVYPPTTCEDPLANNNGSPLPCVYPITSTPDPTYTQIDPPPVDLGVGTPPDNNIGQIQDGEYVVLGLSIVVGSTPDNNYDLVYYEFNNGGVVYLEWIIIGISNSPTGSQYYEVFNWGNGVPDTNSNIGDLAQSTGTEADNIAIPISGNTEVPPSQTELYDPDYVSGPTETNGPAPQTGILIDVDNATSNPPADTYNYVVIISPIGGGSGNDAQVDSVQTVEVPTPVPTP